MQLPRGHRSLSVSCITAGNNCEQGLTAQSESSGRIEESAGVINESAVQGGQCSHFDEAVAKALMISVGAYITTHPDDRRPEGHTDKEAHRSSRCQRSTDRNKDTSADRSGYCNELNVTGSKSSVASNTLFGQCSPLNIIMMVCFGCVDLHRGGQIFEIRLLVVHLSIASLWQQCRKPRMAWY